MKNGIEKYLKVLFDTDKEKLKLELNEKKIATYREEALQEHRVISRNKASSQKHLRVIILRVAAIFVVLLGFSIIILMNLNSRKDYSAFTKDIKKNQLKEETSLILAEGSEIAIHSDESTVKYDQKEGKIEIDGEKFVDIEENRGKDLKKLALNKLIVPYGKQSRLTLSDGTQVWLNAGSCLVYPQEFTDKRREVYLTGEAYFDVTEDAAKPFIVMTNDLKIQVLGTSFNLMAYDDDSRVETMLVDGSVKVTNLSSINPLKNSYTLSPGELARYQKESREMEKHEVDAEQYTSWKDGYFLCESISLERLMQKLSRYYNVQISVEDKDLKNLTFSGKLENRKSIQEVIQIINESTTIKYRETDKNIYIEKNKTN